jgi:hypothetical protein
MERGVDDESTRSLQERPEVVMAARLSAQSQDACEANGKPTGDDEATAMHQFDAPSGLFEVPKTGLRTKTGSRFTPVLVPWLAGDLAVQ